jgi:metal-responsive CopG/Arc/MetJ family transcriptional regulator
MKTAISIPDDLFADAEALTRKLKKSRSQLYAEAIREYLARHDPDAVTEALNQVWDEIEEKTDPAVSAASARILQRTDW